MMFKEIYLTSESIDHEISLIKDEIINSYKVKRYWEADLNQSALIVTDMQQYFLSADSHAFIPSAQAILPNILKLIGFFRQYHLPVIFTKHTNNSENADSMNYWWNDLIKEDSLMAELFGDLNSSEDIIIDKHQYDAFYQTSLEDLLLKYNVKNPVICGVMTNLCCETTIRTAFVKGFRPVLPVDATAAYNRQFHIATFRNLTFGFSPLLATDEVIKSLVK
jgi:bifunctional isochorismate lyase / aryl carrier protein